MTQNLSLAKINANRLSDLPEWSVILNDPNGPVRAPREEMLVLAHTYSHRLPSVDDLSRKMEKPFEVYLLCRRGGSDSLKIADASAQIKQLPALVLRGMVYADQDLIDAVWHSYQSKQGLLEGSKAESSEQALFDEIGRNALLQGASDIHITLLEDRTLISFRTKGELRPVRELSLERGRSLVSAAYNTMAEKGSTKEGFNERSYQDAVIERVFPEGLVRFRYSGLPIAPSGVDVTLRLIPIGITQKPKTLKELGYSDDQIETLERVFSRSSGMVLIAGTTGSGKSTTLATVLTKLAADHPGKKIRTIEEPVEYRIIGAYQTPVLRKEGEGGPANGVNPFQKALRQLMRADPDIIMVGEIRDIDTAQLAIQGVRSGHMLVSTIHADGAPICYDRLIGMGVERNDIASVGLIAGLVYQKLVPILCESCKLTYLQWAKSKAYDPKLDARIKRVVREDHLGMLRFRNPQGCEHCGHDGVKGREVVAEILRPTPEIGAAVQAANSIEIWKQWRSTINRDNPHDMTGRTAFEHAIYKMRQGRVDPRAVEEAFRYLDEPVFGEVAT